MLITPVGRFPIVRAGEHPLRAAVEAWRARGGTTPEAALHDAEIAAAQEETTRELLAEQEAIGVDLLGDGYVPVYDEWFAWAPAVAGVRVGSAIRYLDTNTYYHRWHLIEPPRRVGPSPAVEAYRRAAALTAKPVKPCLFGPYTLWTYAHKEGKAAAPASFDALVEIWVAEVSALAAAGARCVQLEESVLLRTRHRADFPLVARAVQRIAAAVPEVRLLLHLACGAIGDLLQPLLDIPGLAGLGLDFSDVYRAPNLAALAGWRGDKLLQAGILDARQIRVESPAELQETLAAITASVPPARCMAAPSTALLYLPRHVAVEKLAALAAAAHTFVPTEVPA
jgi:5-methyltetrahydropteroyltriglutamate--homocysteine methyltransferase